MSSNRSLLTRPFISQLPEMSRKPPESAQKEQNEYIPNFISKKPFYLESADSENDYLEHQRLQTSTSDQSKWYERGKRLGPAATKFRKGACENCGAMTHKTKECLDRPRAKGARWTGKDIQADEMVQDVQLGWDAKRDRWNGYDAKEYRAVVEEYEDLEILKKAARGEETAEVKGLSGVLEAGSGAGEEAKYAEESDMGRQQSTSTRNLRLREDTAKYLLNLDLDSAKYDPKTRSMVDTGDQVDQAAAALLAEENFMKASGDAAEFEKATKYAWEAQERGDKNKIHLQANPTSGEILRRKEKDESNNRREEQRRKLLEKYGGEQHVQRPEVKNMAVVETERYVEYDEMGAIKGAPKVEAKSKYPEDVLINNHTSVWGSWWFDFQWGYACCHSTVKNSYCTGEEGEEAFATANNLRSGEDLETLESYTRPQEAANEQRLIDQVEQPEREQEKSIAADRNVRKRGLNELKGGVSEDELEAYKRSKTISDDPMAQFLGKDELVR